MTSRSEARADDRRNEYRVYPISSRLNRGLSVCVFPRRVHVAGRTAHPDGAWVEQSTQLSSALLKWRRYQRERWLKKGKDLPPWCSDPARERRSRSGTFDMCSRACSRKRSCVRFASTTSTYVRVVTAATGGIDRLRKRAARTREHSDHRRHVRPPDSGRQSGRRWTALTTRRCNQTQPRRDQSRSTRTRRGEKCRNC